MLVWWWSLKTRERKWWGVNFLALLALIAIATSKFHEGLQNRVAFLESQHATSDVADKLVLLQAGTGEAQTAPDAKATPAVARRPTIKSIAQYFTWFFNAQPLLSPWLGTLHALSEHWLHLDLNKVHIPPGLLFGIVAGISILIAILCIRISQEPFEQEFDEEGGSGQNKSFTSLRSMKSQKSQKEDEIDEDSWKQKADKGELDFYTCMALSVGNHQNFKAMFRFLPRLAIVVIMQLGVSALLIAYHCDSDIRHMTPVEQNIVFRMLGTLLFAYSAWNLTTCMWDDCRTELVDVCMVRDVSGWYSWITIFGEAMNTIVCFVLLGILYLIYCDSTRPTELLINCLAINFVGDIDNSVPTDDDYAEALVNLTVFNERAQMCRRVSEAVEIFRQSPKNAHHHEVTWTTMLQVVFLHINTIVRCYVIPIMAGSLTFLFAFANNVPACRYMRDLETVPFCIVY